MCWIPVFPYNSSADITFSKNSSFLPIVCGSRYAYGRPINAPSSFTKAKSTPHVSIPIEVTGTFSVPRQSDLSLNSHTRKNIPVKCPLSCSIWFGKRVTSSSVNLSPVSVPNMVLPLVAPKSNAIKYLESMLKVYLVNYCGKSRKKKFPSCGRNDFKI